MNCELDTSDDQELSESNFTNDSVLVPELRLHALSYLNCKTLRNYSKCSRYCNSEIQKFNKKPPTIVSIIEKDESILVRHSYARIQFGRCFIEPCYVNILEFPKSENTMEKVKQYLIKLYRNVKEGIAKHLEIDCEKWPTEIMQIADFFKFDKLICYIHSSMLDEFVEFARNNTFKVDTLYLKDKKEEDQIRIPKETSKQIINSHWLQQVRNLTIDLDCEVDDEDFLGLMNTQVHLKLKRRHISNEAIRQKIVEMSESEKQDRITVELDWRIQFDEFEFYRILDYNNLSHSYHIGNVYMSNGHDWKLLIYRRLP